MVSSELYRFADRDRSPGMERYAVVEMVRPTILPDAVVS
jgi:hypothetical protein